MSEENEVSLSELAVGVPDNTKAPSKSTNALSANQGGQPEIAFDEVNDPNDFLDWQYRNLVQQEKRKPLPEDQIKLTIPATSNEYQALIDAGITPDRITSGVLTRQELLNAGYTFVNILGGGEKGIINGIVTDPNTGSEVDFTRRILLTSDEVAMIYRYQQLQPELYGLQGENIDRSSRDKLIRLVQERLINLAQTEVSDLKNKQWFRRWRR